jgi:hypothetical protein
VDTAKRAGPSSTIDDIKSSSGNADYGASIIIGIPAYQK